jgi:hypothetical protein
MRLTAEPKVPTCSQRPRHRGLRGWHSRAGAQAAPLATTLPLLEYPSRALVAFPNQRRGNMGNGQIRDCDHGPPGGEQVRMMHVCAVGCLHWFTLFVHVLVASLPIP